MKAKSLAQSTLGAFAVYRVSDCIDLSRHFPTGAASRQQSASSSRLGSREMTPQVNIVANWLVCERAQCWLWQICGSHFLQEENYALKFYTLILNSSVHISWKCELYMCRRWFFRLDLQYNNSVCRLILYSGKQYIYGTLYFIEFFTILCATCKCSIFAYVCFCGQFLKYTPKSKIKKTTVKVMTYWLRTNWRGVCQGWNWVRNKITNTKHRTNKHSLRSEA